MGFQEDNSEILSDSPTCSKESMRLILNIIASSKWLCWSIDLKLAFLQNRNIDRAIYVKPQKSPLSGYCIMKIKYHYLWTL